MQVTPHSHHRNTLERAANFAYDNRHHIAAAAQRVGRNLRHIFQNEPAARHHREHQRGLREHEEREMRHKNAHKHKHGGGHKHKHEGGTVGHPHRVNVPSEGMSYSLTTTKHKAHKAMKIVENIFPMRTYSYITTGVFAAGTKNQQDVYNTTPAMIMGYNDVKDFAKDIATNFPYAPFNFPVNSINGGANKIYMKGVTSSIEFVNDGNAMNKFIIYDVVAKEDTSVQPVTAWSNGIGDYSPVGWIPSAGGTVGAAAITDPGCKPTWSPQFNSLYRVEKAHRIDLPSGRTHKHTFYRQFDQPLELGELIRRGANINFKKLSFGFFVVQEGIMAYGATSGADICGSNIVPFKLRNKYSYFLALSSVPEIASDVNIAAAVGNEEVFVEETGIKSIVTTS